MVFGRQSLLWKYFGLIFLFCLLTISGVYAQTLRAMAYNIRHGSNVHDRLQLKQIGALIRQNNFDVVGLVEVDSVCNRSGKTDQTAILSKMTGMEGVFVRHFAFDGGAYGLALLSRFPITEVENVRIPIMTRENGDSTRALLMAKVKIPGSRPLEIIVAHLDYRSKASRIRQVNFLLDLTKEKDGPVMVMGDLNADPDAGAMRILQSHFVDINKKNRMTFPEDIPTKKIDYILVDKRHFKNTLKDTVYPVQYSDHRPIAAEFTFSDKD